MLNLENLKEIVKINYPEEIHFDVILKYLEDVKNYKIEENINSYECEWLDVIFLDEIISEENIYNLPPNEKISYITTYNFLKVPKIIEII